MPIHQYYTKVKDQFFKNDGSIRSKTINSGIWVSIGSGTVKIIEFFRSIILARLLTPEIFGLIGIVMFINAGIEIFTQTGFGAAIIHRKKTDARTMNTAWIIAIIRGFFLAGLLALSAPFIAQFYSQTIIESLLEILALGFVIRGFQNINVILFEKQLQFKKIAILEQVSSIVNFIVVVSLAYVYRNVWAVIGGQIAYYISNMLLSYFIQPVRPKLQFDITIAKELIKYGKFVTGAGIVVFLTTEIDNAVIGKILGMEALGFYVLAYTIANIPATHITQIVSKIMLPSYSQMQDDLQAMKKVFLKVLSLISMFTIPAAFGIAFLAPEIISIIYGEKWESSVEVLQILCAFGAVRAVSANNGPIYYATGKPHYSFYINAVKLVLFSILIIPVVKGYGIKGAAVTIVACAVFMQIFSIKIMMSLIKIKISEYFKIILPPIIGSVIMSFALIYLKSLWEIITFFQLVCGIGFGAAIYFLSLFFVKKIYYFKVSFSYE